MGRILSLSYGTLAYVMFLAVFLYAIGFVGNFLVPKSMDSPAEGPLGMALLINTLLLSLFAVQHSVMARPWFKRATTRVIPKHVERSTYVLLSNLALILLFWQWRPLGGVIWEVDSSLGRAAVHGVYALGWAVLLISTFLVNHFDLFGLRQVWLRMRRQEYTDLKFKESSFYKWIRHPIYLGWLLIFWAAPTMTITHLFFAVVTSVYILVAIQFEEKDLIDEHGETYLNYKRRVPMLVPRGKRNNSNVEGMAAEA